MRVLPENPKENSTSKVEHRRSICFISFCRKSVWVMPLWSLILFHLDWITGCPDMLLQFEWHHPIHEGLHVTKRWRKGGCTALGLTAWDRTLISFCPQWSSFLGLQTEGVYTISSPAPRLSNYTSSFPGSPVCRLWNSLAAIISWININQPTNQSMNQSYWIYLSWESWQIQV